jgi:hypothetical protein
MRNAAKLIGAAGTAVGALAVLASIHDGVIDAGADVLLVGSLLTIAHAVFRLVDDSDEMPVDGPEPPPGQARRGR